MGDTVSLRPSHYDMLGVSPTASGDEINRAFKHQLNQISIRPFGWLAQVSIAYETLRDPAKRRAYDDSIAPKSMMAGHPVFAQLFRPVAAPPVKAAAPAPTPTPKTEWKPAPIAPIMFRDPRPAEPAVEPTRAAEPDPEVEVRRAIAEEHERKAQAALRSPLRRDPPERMAPKAEMSGDWKLPGLAAGALILAAAGGAWAGIEAGNDNEDALPDRVATLRVPPAKPDPASEPLQPAAPAAFDAQPVQRPPASVASVEPVRPPLEIDLADVPPPDTAQSEQAEPAAEPAIAAASVDSVLAARLPLSNAVIARTIHRIGYGCGQVASTAAIDGQAGAFKVTCTSGQSYRAAPVRGRYHFRRMAGR